MRDILQDPKELHQRNPVRLSNRHWKKLVWLLLLLAGLGGAGMRLGPQFYGWAKNYNCATQNLKNKKPQAAFMCLESFSPAAADRFTRLGLDLHKLYLAVISQWLQAQQYQKALEVSEAGRRRFAWEPAFLGDQALALFGLGRFQEAVSVMEAFMKSPKFEQTQKVNGVRIDLAAAQIYLGAQKFTEAELYLQKAFEIDPANATGYLLYARLEAVRQNTQAMTAHYQKVLAGDPKQLAWQDLFLLALNYLNRGQTEKFQQIFAEARRDFPNASGFHLLLALKYLKEGNYASAYYEVLFEKEVGLTDSAYFKEAVQEIEKKFQEAFKKQPSEASLLTLHHFIQGKEAYENRDYPKALAWIEQSLQGETHPLQSLYLGRALAGMGQTDRAIGYYGAVISKQETFAVATAELAGLYLQKGVPDAAQNLWNKAVSIDPEIAHLSDVGLRLAQQNPNRTIVKISQGYNVRSNDHLMQVQLNQLISNSFANAF